MLPIQLRVRPLHNRHMTVALHEPAATDECPILQEPIATATLDCFPRPFLLDRPTYKAMTLECKHTFHAMSLVYHWARNGNVACPICRAGPRGQRLVMSHLPREWRHSMAARVRRERRADRAEEELRNRQLAFQQPVPPPSLDLDFRIEAEPGTEPAHCTVRTMIVPTHDAILFIVPEEELRKIPFKADTLVRIVPYTQMHILTPSNWFRAGLDPGNNFGAHRAPEGGFQHLNLTVSEDLFAMMVVDSFMRHAVQ